jgi:hypothetical protein
MSRVEFELCENMSIRSYKSTLTKLIHLNMSKFLTLIL